MLDILRKYRFHFIAGLALFAALIFYSLHLRRQEQAGPLEQMVLSATAPMHRAGAGVSRSIRSLWDDYLSLVNLRDENRRLLEVARTQNRTIFAQNEAVLENERLRSLLEMKRSLQAPSVTAAIIAEDGTAWFRSIILDKGANDGIRDGMPVVTGAGVVGQVVKASPRTARVLLLTDHSCAMAATVQRSRARGVVRGQGTLCSLEFALRDEDVKVGDQMITSGVGGVFPKGIPIGEVTMVKKGPYGIFQTIQIRPAVNLSRLEEVLVLLTDLR